VVSWDDGKLELTVGERTLCFPAVWLRDNCPCPACRDPDSGQKLKDITDIPNGLAVAAAEDIGESVVVTYAPDRHQSTFARSWLARHALGYGGADGTGEDGRTEDDKQLWLPADLDQLPQGSWPRYLADPADRAGVLDAVLRWGFVLLRDVPAEAGRVLEVAASFGFVRETNYGRLFDVRIEPRPANLAFTRRRILPHTDNPYRDPVPTVQLLHCLRAADDGGETSLTDGFAAARELRATDGETFQIMAGTPVPFGYTDQSTELRASQPLIQLSPRGRVRGIRFNNRSARPLRLPYAEVTAFYAAYRRWAELLARPERQLKLRLAPGDCLIFDNTRILHGRTAFGGTGGRHLQGCYADLDGLASTLAVLRREEKGREEKGRKEPEGRSNMTAIEAIGELFAGPGANDYLGEPVTIGEHLRQAGALAEAAGADDALVAAALLHDVGHLRSAPGVGHGEAGAQWLSQWFGQAVTEPVRLHVAAKRYLCTAEPGYFGLLSAESVRSLALQGGPMTAEEAAEFAAAPHAQEAVAVRRWDDQAKDPAVTAPPFAHFAPLLEALTRR